MGRDKKQPKTIEAFPPPKKPAELGPSASRWWDHVCECRKGSLGPLEAFLMEQACVWLNLQDKLQAEADKYTEPGDSPWHRSGRRRGAEPDPESPILTIPRLTEISKAIQIVQAGFLRVCGELGLTPKAAARVKAPKILNPGGATGRKAGERRSGLDSLMPTDFPTPPPPPPPIAAPADDQDGEEEAAPEEAAEGA